MHPQQPGRPRRPRRLASVAVAAAVVVALAPTAAAGTPPGHAGQHGGPGQHDPGHGHGPGKRGPGHHGPGRDRTPDLGPDVVVLDPDMPTAEVQAAFDAVHTRQVDAEMGADRTTLYLLPGEYGSAEEPLRIQVGYYTEVSGLGASPSDVVVHGTIEVYNRCLEDGGTANCIALNNFWRTLSNLTLDIEAAPRDGCRQTANFWAVSQAVSVRRLDVRTGEGEPQFSLMDYCTAGPQYASGGFIADSRFGTVLNGSQQQWLVRDSVVGEWTNGVWNQVFAGVEGAPSDATFPDPPYTTLDRTPVSREKPYVHVDPRGRWKVRVPSARTGTRGVTWDDGVTPGRSLSLDDFYVASPGDPVRRINRELARGRHLLLTPGVYDVDRTIEVRHPGTVVLGTGHATLTAVDGAVPLRVADVPGVVVAGVTIDAGLEESPVLLQVGERPGKGTGHDKHGEHGKHGRHGEHGHGKGHDEHAKALGPITLSDVYFRVGGPHVGKVDTALRIDADGVLVDHTWVWRGDHGVEDFEGGFLGDDERWVTNTGRNGVVVTGDDVTATGLFVEHFQEHNTVWEGERGCVVLYQNELPYDPPTQADWTEPDGTLGWAGYKVGPKVRTHELWGGGVYVYNRNDPSIVTEDGFEVPRRPGVRLHHVMTVNLGAGTIRHVVNGVGGQVDNSNTGTPAYVAQYP